MILKVRQAGEAVLRQQARPLSLDEVRSADIGRLIELMRETMRDAPGVGLAAPQIGESIQLAVIEDREEYHRSVAPELLAERERSPVPFQVIINPRLTVDDRATAAFFEGCLSVTGYGAIVPRARAVRVECLNERAEEVVIEARGWYARILQHEIDHLNGVLYVDRMEPRSFTSAENLNRHWKDKPIQEASASLGISTAKPGAG
jgi:peptide deformylase